MNNNEKKIPDSVKMEDVLCPLCDNADNKIILKGFDRLNGLPGEFAIVQCLSCGLIRTTPRPDPSSIGFYYPDDYGAYEGSKIKKIKPWKKKLHSILNLNSNTIPDLKSGHMLEVGCASGSYMNKMRESGWEVEGIEFSEYAAENARSLGFPVFTGTIESAPDPEHLYDMIVGWMVLEHLHDPIRSLEKMNKWLKPGGFLIFSVPNIETLEFKFFKNAWYALQLPCHLYHFTPNSIDEMLSKCGFKIKRILHHRVLGNLIASLGYKLSDWGLGCKLTKKLTNFPQKAKAMNYVLFPLAIIMAFFKQTGRMTIWAQRSE